MKKKLSNLSINHVIYLFVLLLPFLLMFVYGFINQNTPGIISLTSIINEFNSMFGNFGFIQQLFKDLIEYFGVDSTSFIALFTCTYFSYFIIVSILHIVVDALLFLPNMILGVFKNE